MAQIPIQQTRELVMPVHEAAARLSVSPRTVWGLISSGRLKAIKLGPRTTRIADSAIATFIEDCSKDVAR